MYNNILEISEKTSKGGRVPIKIALLKIHESPEETNRNGLHWDEQYVLNAIDSAKLIPICAEFNSVDKDVPYGHGLTDTVVDENGISEPQFLNSETVGVIESASIETIKENGNDIKVLAGTGYLYHQRYPNFTKWVRTNYATGTVDTSIEIMGLKSNNNKIVYKEEKPTDKFRTPLEFCFSGTAIISIQPADSSAIVLEVAQRKDQNKEDVEKMEFDMNEVRTAIKDTMAEINSTNEKEFVAKIEELNSQLVEKDNVIAQKDSELCEKDEKISELNATVEQVQKALDDLKKEHQSYWAEREALEKELGQLKAKARIGELNSAIECFSEEERKFAESEINSFNEAPLEGDIDAIVGKIYMEIGKANKKASEEARVTEQNSAHEVDVEDIFSEMCEEVHAEEQEDLNIF